ncbi:sigma-54 interaction domain-containing protein [Ideonella sp. YS5]|uniref:sigma-54 interaction domain-containing protein n=1 Tax=Ideonella sp. YS5 TaxID=3453714 RepID=UPI003F701422
MTQPARHFNDNLLTLPPSSTSVLSIRAKALLFHDARSLGLLEDVERIARSEASALIIGETGTGKELIARHLHTRSGRKGPFVAVNCGAFSENLIDAELFGHESGAFTGASQSRAGWFEAANGGTLFLDEIGDLPLPLQIKLLRVLQERQVVRLGSRRPIALDVRLVAATNIDLRQAVEAQRFRADLYYRLNVAAINVPPLRERTGDILPLARHFVGVYGPRLGMEEADFDDEAHAALLAYPWPGNIRELENIVHFALIVCREGVIRAGDLRLVAVNGSSASGAQAAGVHERTTAPGDASAPRAAGVNLGGDPHAPLRHAISALLATRSPDLFHSVIGVMAKAAYARCGRNQVQAALALGITRNTFRTLVKRYDMQDDAGNELTA